MTAAAILIVFLAGCVLAAVLPDHRDLDDRDDRGWWPGVPRR
jgi:hypothetical protein